jgi:acyl CoA:acetate/3-ketoacid CoA transferase beta subunit
MVLVGIQTPDKFPEAVDFITSVGHLKGGNSRQEAGLLGSGPVAVISPWGVYDFHPVSKRMRVKSLTPGVTFEIAQSLTGFELLKPDGDIPQTKLITDDALKIIRTEVDPRGVFTTMPT